MRHSGNMGGKSLKALAGASNPQSNKREAPHTAGVGNESKPDVKGAQGPSGGLEGSLKSAGAHLAKQAAAGIHKVGRH